jgi:hypothetical protein
LPIELLAHREHRFLIGIAIDRGRNGHETRVESGECPVLEIVALGALELPVGYFAQGVNYFFLLECRRQVSGERACVRGRVADDLELF